MKKKIEVLMQDGRLSGNSAFAKLHTHYQAAKNTAKKAKSEKSKAKAAYRNAAEEAGKKHRDARMELLTAFRQAKFMQKFHRAALNLAEYRLSLWLENWSAESPEPHAAAPAKQIKAVKKQKTSAKPLAKPAKGSQVSAAPKKPRAAKSKAA